MFIDAVLDQPFDADGGVIMLQKLPDSPEHNYTAYTLLAHIIDQYKMQEKKKKN